MGYSVYCIGMSLSMGVCRFLVAFCDDFKETVQDLNVEILQLMLSKKTLTEEKRIRLKISFNELIKFQADIRQLSIDG